MTSQLRQDGWYIISARNAAATANYPDVIEGKDLLLTEHLFTKTYPSARLA